MLVPGMYTDVSTTYLFTSKTRRIIVLLAGIYSELILWSLAVIWFASGHPHGLLRLILLTIITIVGFRNALFNLNIFLKTDGYFILQELLNQTNLFDKAMDKTTRGSNLFLKLYYYGIWTYSIGLLIFSLWTIYKSMTVHTWPWWAFIPGLLYTAIFFILIKLKK